MKRDRQGPRGQPIGSITTAPKDIDAITIRAWSNKCKGNKHSGKSRVNDVLGIYGKYTHKAPPISLPPITAAQVEAAFKNAPKNAGGMDGWTPAEQALLSPKACAWLARLLNAIESGAPWPDGQNHGRLAFWKKTRETLPMPSLTAY